MFLVNGKPANSVSLSDRSFQYGDGCFSTLLLIEGEPQHWPYHRERLSACLSVLGIAEPDWELVYRWVKDVGRAQQQGALRYGAKIHISRGVGGRGYGVSGVGEPCVTVSAFGYPNHYLAWQEDGVQLGVSQTSLGHSPMLAGHKHNNRLEQVLIKAELERKGWQDALVLDIDGHVVETSVANLFWRDANNQWHSPKLDKAGVAGVMRRCVLERFHQLGQSCVLSYASLDDVLAAKELFITNSLLQVVPVTAIGSQSWTIGEFTRTIQERLNS